MYCWQKWWSNSIPIGNNSFSPTGIIGWFSSCFFHCPGGNSPVVQIVWSRKTCFLRGMSNMPTLPDVTFGNVLLSKKHGISSSSMILFLVGSLFCTASLQNVDMVKSHQKTHWFLIFRWTAIYRKTLANLGAWLGPRSDRQKGWPLI